MFLFELFTHALKPLFLNASCCHWNIQRRVNAQFVSYGALANLPIDKPINHSGFIMSLWFYLFLYFLLLWQKSFLETEPGNVHIRSHWRQLRYCSTFCGEENNPICLKKRSCACWAYFPSTIWKPKHFLWVLQFQFFRVKSSQTEVWISTQVNSQHFVMQTICVCVCVCIVTEKDVLTQ